jgi:hypothetical protein
VALLPSHSPVHNDPLPLTGWGVLVYLHN